VCGADLLRSAVVFKPTRGILKPPW